MNEEILGGLKSALERGESLKRAMATFFNAGYKKEEIEEAARALTEPKPESHTITPVKTTPQTTQSKESPIQPQMQTKPPPSPTKTKQPPVKSPQKVSGYEEKKKPKKNLIIILIISLVLLIGISITILLLS